MSGAPRGKGHPPGLAAVRAPEPAAATDAAGRPGAASPSVAIFCDFDGTISENDMIVQIMRRFVPAEAEPLIQAVTERRMSVAEGVGRMFALIPSVRFPEVARFARETVRIRAGFAEFVAFCAARGWPLSVVSGGFDFFVDPALAPYRDKLRVFRNHIDTSGERLRVVWSEPCDELCDGGCGLCKPSVLRRYGQGAARRIVIGDGVTDLKAARMADFVFARAGLLRACAEEGLPHAAFDDFHDIVRGLTELARGGDDFWRKP
ncbi:2-hydroxy-3-keto-5-methylthiopentenyl-1-phosphate phosphatase [Alicyclobacillus cellulosilyticus]|uniref:2-hydroxy-3-keto-5-methylthiopentenyl-1-phosphate phosphatase n=1 Tax=Alicyclobacillus cellulosilyticus TaxID=1003997 RepID=A0A917KAD8_9BACL|nr:MtnX-like HAD-IB family phosphatase [Alicyclobacillus cellulosilyticus]GGJ06811.1 2-hydroxy-3-keto-5-methylthiopentenyl-1-phosphate phosphatase [Alicyclobacillus cellulosilyticus]